MNDCMHYIADDVFFEDDVLAGKMIALKRLSDIKDEPLHDHDFVEIVYIHDGKGVHYVNGVEYPVRKGDLLYINYGCTHSFKVDERLVASNIMIKLGFWERMVMNNDNIFCLMALTSFEKIQEELDKTKPLISFNAEERKEIQYILEKMKEELSGNLEGKDSLLSSYMNVLLTRIFRKILTFNNENEIVFSEIVEYIRAHCEEKITLKSMAERCFYNPAYFCRLFKKAYNMTLTDFITEQRLKRACTLLKETNLSNEEIMARCGFSDKTGFYNRFKRTYGCTPSEYKKYSGVE